MLQVLSNERHRQLYDLNNNHKASRAARAAAASAADRPGASAQASRARQSGSVNSARQGLCRLILNPLLNATMCPDGQRD